MLSSSPCVLAVAALDYRDETTLKHVAQIIHLLGAQTLYLAHVTPTFDASSLPGVSAPERPLDEEIEARLRAAYADQAALFPAELQVEYVVREGALVTELARLATQKSADLICLGRLPSEEETDPGLAAAVLRKAPCSALIVPAHAAERYTRILVTTDFSELALESIRSAARLARATPGAQLTIVNVYSLPLGYHKSGIPSERMADEMLALSKRLWAESLEQLDLSGVNWSIRFEFGSNIPRTVLAVAKELDVHLLVLASHGRTMPAAMLLGHVADAVADQAARPLLCLKKKGHVVNLLRAIGEVFGITD